MTLYAFLFFLLGMTCLIGLLAARQSRKSEQDYFLAGQNVSPYMLAFSSNASKFSGFVFAGFMGAAYTNGTSAIWLGAGLLLGSLLAYPLTVLRVQQLNSGGWALSIAELVTFWHGENRVWLRRVIGLFTLIFLSVYAAAQLKASGKIMSVISDWPGAVGILLSTVIILFYCWSGGIRASIWTDAIQITLMTVSLLLILIALTVQVGGIGPVLEAFVATAPHTDEVALFPANLSIGGPPGLALYFLGSIGFGVATLGQPHLLIRAMALKSRSDTKKFLITNYLFEAAFIVLFVLVGLSTRIILQDAGEFDAELSLFLSAQKMLPPLAVALVLAGAFSSALSTADSQILSCSASLIRDLPEPPKESLMLAKLGTVSVAIVATLIALFAGKDIFSLVTFAFAGLGTSIGSVLILRLLNVDLPEWGALCVVVAGGGVVIAWNLLGLKSIIHESVPGFIGAFGVFFLIKAGLILCRPSRSSPPAP